MRRQLQKAIWRVSVVTQTMIERQNMQPSDRVSRLMVQRGITMDSGLRVDSSILFPIGKAVGNLKPLSILAIPSWHAAKCLCIMWLLQT